MIDRNDSAGGQPPQILTVGEVCELLHMSPNTWRAFAKKNRVPEAFISSPRRKLYYGPTIQQLIDGTYTPPTAAKGGKGK